MISYKELPRYLPVPGPDINSQQSYIENVFMKEDMSKASKRKLVGDDIERLVTLFTANSIPLPNNLLDRVKLLGLLDYMWISKKRGSKTSAFAPTDTTTGYVSTWDAQYFTQKYPISKKDWLRTTYIHELLHTLEVKEWWMSTHPDDKDYMGNRRIGLSASRPQEDDKRITTTIGGRKLGEGITEYLAREITGVEEPEGIKTYQAEVEVVNYLIEEIGIEPLIAAEFTKRGLRALNGKMVEVFGPGSLRMMSWYMGAEYLLFKNRQAAVEKIKKAAGESSEQDIKLESYSATLVYLRQSKWLNDMRKRLPDL